MHEVGELLARSVPVPPKVAIIHNDLKLDNCQLRADDPDRVTSVFDWDMATLGDPLFDLGLMLTSMSGNAGVWTLSNDDAVARYQERSGIDIEHMDWYLAFAAWRTAVVVQQLANRYRAGDSTDERLASFADVVPGLAARAHDLLARR